MKSYEKLYVMLNSAQMDDFCQWIYDSRENDGDIFYLGKWYFVIEILYYYNTSKGLSSGEVDSKGKRILDA